MINILLSTWKKRIKIIDDDSLFKAFFLFFLISSAVLTTVCFVFFLNSQDYLLMLFLNTFLVIYNKPTILSCIQRKRNAGFFLNKKVFWNYISFQIIKENILILIVIVANIIALFYSVFYLKSIVSLAIFLFSIDFYLIELYRSEKKIILLLFLGCLVGCILKCNLWITALVIVLNVIFLFYTFYNEVIHGLYIDNYKNVGITGAKVGIFRLNLCYFLRMSLDKIIKILYEIILCCITLHYIEINIASYVLVTIFLVDMELMQDEKMQEFDLHYGKRNFLFFTKLSNLRKFFASLEFNHVIKYVILILVMLVQEIQKYEDASKVVPICMNLLLLFGALSFRYYGATNIVLKNRMNIKHTWFRLVMLYLVLFNLSPFMFYDTLIKMDGYRVEYGYLFSIILDLLVMFVNVEKIINISGGERECKREKQV